ncbi:hypothetical protein [Longimicrobium terrae]|uniref:Uncharacterized protein n=1 Tax=Longimicrobium terrae TaxID=1639882 RepID=A0A841H6X1_9BACT|nr:hypothetical protein [Longimicrobium terrae]MBB4639147.1 hypothetical protein [Longimicrobium terrae]MBB6073449.1 hypothetical protein [Longimicrobium terrae]NNC32563.1 hypothetical protein [Longimicrobium terrae]
MPYLQEPDASHGRDRGAPVPRRRLGPYEAAYDVRMGYQEPVEAGARTPAPEPLLFRGRGDRER